MPMVAEKRAADRSRVLRQRRGPRGSRILAASSSAGPRAGERTRCRPGAPAGPTCCSPVTTTAPGRSPCPTEPSEYPTTGRRPLPGHDHHDHISPSMCAAKVGAGPIALRNSVACRRPLPEGRLADPVRRAVDVLRLAATDPAARGWVRLRPGHRTRSPDQRRLERRRERRPHHARPPPPRMPSAAARGRGDHLRHALPLGHRQHHPPIGPAGRPPGRMGGSGRSEGG